MAEWNAKELAQFEKDSQAARNARASRLFNYLKRTRTAEEAASQLAREFADWPQYGGGLTDEEVARLLGSKAAESAGNGVATGNGTARTARAVGAPALTVLPEPVDVNAPSDTLLLWAKPLAGYGVKIMSDIAQKTATIARLQREIEALQGKAEVAQEVSAIGKAVSGMAEAMQYIKSEPALAGIRGEIAANVAAYAMLYDQQQVAGEPEGEQPEGAPSEDESSEDDEEEEPLPVAA